MDICTEKEKFSLWMPNELVPFFSQHKWSWSRPESSTVRLPLCADSIRNNCILASLHLSPFTTFLFFYYFFLLWCWKLQHKSSNIAAWLLLVFFLSFKVHNPVDWMGRVFFPPGKSSHCGLYLRRANTFQVLFSLNKVVFEMQRACHDFALCQTQCSISFGLRSVLQLDIPKHSLYSLIILS